MSKNTVYIAKLVTSFFLIAIVAAVAIGAPYSHAGSTLVTVLTSVFGEVGASPGFIPSITTKAPSSVGLNAATLNGSANPNGDATIAYFRYDNADPGSCSDLFGTKTPDHNIGNGTSNVDYSDQVTGLNSLQTYYYCAVATNSAGTSFGTVLHFTTNPALPQAPTITGTTPPSPSQSTTPTVNGHTNDAVTTNIDLYTNSDCATGAIGTAAVSPGSNVNFSIPVTTPLPTDVTTTIYACSRNLTGTSPASNGWAYTQDQTKPGKPTNLHSTPSTPNPDTQPHILGDAEPGSTVNIFISQSCGGTSKGSGTATGGHFNIQVNTLLAANTSTFFTANATDAAGNTSDCSDVFRYDAFAQPVVTGISPSNGPTTGGTAIVISGSNFAVGQSTIDIGGNNCPVTNPNPSGDPNSSVKLHCTTPAGSGSVHVRVTTPGGTSDATANDLFTYTGPTNPSGIGAATPDTVELSGSTLLTVTVTPGSGPASTELSVTADLSSLGGSESQQFYDDGSHGDASAGDRVFSFLFTPTAPSNGPASLPFLVTDAQSRTGTGSIGLTVNPPPATLVVNTADDHDDGFCTVADCTLREAINAANIDSDFSTINFNIPGSGVHTISLTSVLPAVIAEVSINGYSQSGATENTETLTDNAVILIVVEGSAISDGPNDGFILDANSSISGLVISGFSGSGVQISEGGSGSSIAGNFIGTNAAGSAAAANGIGIKIYGAFGTLVGCETAGERNIISGNAGDAVLITGGASINGVQGNFIGLAADGSSALGNTGSGVVISSDPNVGGSVANYIGTYPTITPRPNELAPAHKCQSSSRANITSDPYTPANFIAYNALDGVGIVGTADVDNVISQNVIYSNSGLGIDLGGDGVTPNDALDADGDEPYPPFANYGQNFPVISSAVANNGTNTISGTLNSHPGESYAIEFYANSACNAASPNDYGEGKAYLGSINAGPADSNGDISFTFNPTDLTIGQFITATATDGNGNTSEFSKCAQVVDGSPADTPPTLIYTPLQATSSQDAVNLTVNASDDHGVTNVTIFYTVNGNSSSAICSSTGSGSYNCQIPAQTTGTAVIYYVTATDTAMQTTTVPSSSAPNLYTVGAATIPSIEYTNVSLWDGSSLGGNITVDKNLDLRGIVNAGSYTLTLGCNGTVSGAGPTAYVIGRFQKSFCGPTGADGFMFPIGTTPSSTLTTGAGLAADAAGFSPFTANVTSADQGAALTVFVVDGDMPGADASQSASRYWDVTKSGTLTADLNYKYLDQDVNGTEANYKVLKREGGNTVIVPGGTVDPSTNTATIASVSSFSQWGAGVLPLVTTAARVSMGGRVLTSDGRGIANVLITATGDSLTQPLVTRTNAFGYYMIEGVSSGRSYVVTADARHFTFLQPSVIVSLRDDVSDINFTALP
jgi:CSLREA domain-containing protein